MERIRPDSEQALDTTFDIAALERQAFNDSQRAWRKRQWRKRRYHQLRKQLIAKLGKECAKCHGKRKLEIDHVQGRQWSVTQASYLDRLYRYIREWESGVKLRLLCQKCNGAYRP